MELHRLLPLLHDDLPHPLWGVDRAPLGLHEDTETRGLFSVVVITVIIIIIVIVIIMMPSAIAFMRYVLSMSVFFVLGIDLSMVIGLDQKYQPKPFKNEDIDDQQQIEARLFEIARAFRSGWPV